MTRRLRDAATWVDSRATNFLSLDPVWLGWLAVLTLSVALVRLVVGPRPIEEGYRWIPWYLLTAGVMSVLYAVTVPQGQRDAARKRFLIGVSVIPGMTGLITATLGAFLLLTFSTKDLPLLIVSLPVIFGVAPAFGLFAYGYKRGEPAIGARGYRYTFVAFVVFLVLAGLLFLFRSVDLMNRGDGKLVPLLAVPVVITVLIANLEYRRRAARRPPTDNIGEQARQLRTGAGVESDRGQSSGRSP